MRLASESLIETQPNKGFIVRPLMVQDIKAMFEALRIIELGTASLAVHQDPTRHGFKEESLKDRIKTYLSILFFALALILPLIGGAIGWAGWEFKVGVIVAAIVFSVCFVLGVLFALLVQEPAWFEILTPFVSGILYSVLNLVPLPFDDVLVAIAGAVTSYTMALKRYTEAPKWIVAPPLAAAVYTLFGEFIPGPVDELAVSFVAAIISSVGAAASTRRAGNGEPPALEEGAVEQHEEAMIKGPESRDA